MKVCIDPGHGGKTSGAVGKYSKEKDINLKLALKMSEKLTKCGIDVLLTRKDDTYVSLAERCKMANRAKCNYFISIHCNAFSDSGANGTVTYYFEGSPTSRNLAAVIHDAAVKYNKNYNRGLQTDEFYVLNYTVMPAVLLGSAFISNEREEDMLNDAAWQEGFTDAVSQAVCSYLRKFSKR